MRTSERLLALAALLVALVTVLAGCTGVPQSSRPEVVKTLPVAGGPAAPASLAHPAPGIVPNDLVQLFLSLNSLPAGNYASARNFLTPAERSRWQDTTATILDTATVGLYSPKHPRIVVRGQVLGTLNPSGVYAPSNTSLSGRQTSFTFRIARVHGQYRISGPPPGLLLTESQFETSFSQRNLYFFDLAQKYLVPDPRWTALTDPTQLDEWLLTELASGPATQLASSVSPLPTQATGRRINVTVGSPTKIEIPGASQLDGAARSRLAAQIATTLDESDRRDFEVTDGGSPVKIASVGRSEFTASDFSQLSGPPQPAGDVYFVRSGKLVSGDDFTTLKGAVNNGNFYLGSVAVSRSDPTGELSIAALAAVGVKEELLVGTQTAGLRATSIRGQLSRPAFAPGRDEAWVGGVGATGSKIDLVDITGRNYKISRVGLPSSIGRGQIIALRLSPEGSRIALVIKAAGGDQQLYIGAIVRGGGQVRIATLEQISTANAVISDVGWVEPTKLYAIGVSTSASVDPHVYETDVDGSEWTVMSIGVMPEPPSSFTVTPNQAGWAESGGSLWVQSGGSNWESAGPTGQTAGHNPVYLG
jgi:hypothetical protein